MKIHIFILAMLVNIALHAADKIPIKTIKTTKGIDNAHLSFDGNIATSWFPGWSQEIGEMIVTFDGTYELSSIRYLDGSGQPTLLFYADDKPTPFKNIFLHQYLVWGEEKIGVTTTSIRIELHGIQGDKVVPEIEFYGKKVGAGNTTPAPTPTTPLSGVSTRICVNGFHWIPMDKMKPFKMKRDFQMSGWTWTPNGFSPQPLYGAATATVQGYDDYFAAAKAAGIDIVPCVNETPSWFWGLPEEPAMYFYGDEDYPYYNPKLSLIAALDTTDGPPVPISYSTERHPKTLPCGPGGKRDDPSSYIEYARFMFQYAARYGRKAWDESVIEVNQEPLYQNSPINQKKSGLDLLKYIEMWNEFDAWWLDASVYATPEQAAAFMSACYDGHGGTLGPYVGIKQADPTMIVIMPGLTGPDKKYLERLVVWCRTNRPNGDLPFDICNFHHYSNTTNQAGRWPPTWTTGAPADCDAAWSDVEAFVKYAHSLGKPVWWTEMGYDSKEPSWQYAKPYGPYVADYLQAIWIVRNYLMSFRAGIEATFVFNAINEPGAPNGGLYQNSGILYGAGDAQPFTPKPAYNAIVELINQLSGYDYAADVSPSSKVKILAFKSKTDTKIVYWSATMDGSMANIKYQGKNLIVTETPQYASIGRRSVSTKTNLLIKTFNRKAVPRLRK